MKMILRLSHYCPTITESPRKEQSRHPTGSLEYRLEQIVFLYPIVIVLMQVIREMALVYTL